jgi:hypothetical protein
VRDEGIDRRQRRGKGNMRIEKDIMKKKAKGPERWALEKREREQEGRRGREAMVKTRGEKQTDDESRSRRHSINPMTTTRERRRRAWLDPTAFPWEEGETRNRVNEEYGWEDGVEEYQLHASPESRQRQPNQLSAGGSWFEFA